MGSEDSSVQGEDMALITKVCSTCGGGYIGLKCEPCDTYIKPLQADIDRTLANMQSEAARVKFLPPAKEDPYAMQAG